MNAQSTTQDEYDFITSMKTGYETKDGYTFGDSHTYNVDKETFTFKPLKRSNGETAAIILVVHADGKLGIKFNYIMCIPRNNAALSKEFNDYVDRRWTLDICQSYSKVASGILVDLFK
jgi:hypothetical protein